MGVPAKLAIVIATVIVVMGLSLVFASQGVRDDDHDRNIEQPEQLFLDLEARAAYNDEDIFWRFEWETETPHFYHDYLVYEGGEWVRYGSSMVGTQPEGVYEDRLTFLLDDGSVDDFEEYGGFMTIVADGGRFMPDEADPEEVEEILGEGRDDVRKFLPGTREDPSDWRTVRSDDELEQLREAGYFLDLWHWRAHRSNPIGWSDDQLVFDYRLGDDGEAPYTTNWDDETELPEYMFDPDVAGQHAMDWDRVLDMDYGQDDHYYLAEDENAVSFDPDHDWQEGDVIPRRLLQEPEGSRGQIFAQGIAQNGTWQLELQRALDTGYPLDDKTLEEYGQYDVAFAVHAYATGSRWHYIGMPETLGLGRDADIEAVRFDGEQPPWDEIEPTTRTLFYPGAIGWDHLTDRSAHVGADDMEGGTPFSVAHDIEDMAYYALESEFRDDIVNRWLVTGALWVLFIIAGSVAYIRVARRADDAEPATTGAATEE